jgi:hypothetical protein
VTLDRYQYSDDNPTTLVDPSGHDSEGICLVGGGALGPVGGFSLEVCYVTTGSGQSGITVTPTVAGGMGLGAYGGVEGQVSTAVDISDLGGPFGTAGGSVDVGIGVQASVWGGVGHCGNNNVTGASGGLSIGGGASAYSGGQFTFPFKLTGGEDQPCSTKSEVLR